MDLLLKIARCPIAERCLSGEIGHGCSKIVRSQVVDPSSQFQSPEPWSGQLSVAPILFLSSNPSIGPTTDNQYPRASWGDESIIEYFEYRFDDRPLSSVKHGIYDAPPGSVRGAGGVKYWIGVRARAAELLGKSSNDVVAGTDYALTEVVRCKSKSEHGVREALPTCVREYLEPTLGASVANVIVVLGVLAKKTVCDRYGLEPTVSLHGPLLIASRMRLVTFLPHPTAFKPKTFSKCLLPSDLERLRQWLKTAENHAVGEAQEMPLHTPKAQAV